MGAPPGGAAGKDDAARPHVRVLARELSAMPASRFACLCEPCPLPKSGTQAVRFEVCKQCLGSGGIACGCSVHVWALCTRAKTPQRKALSMGCRCAAADGHGGGRLAGALPDAASGHIRLGAQHAPCRREPFSPVAAPCNGCGIMQPRTLASTLHALLEWLFNRASMRCSGAGRERSTRNAVRASRTCVNA